MPLTHGWSYLLAPFLALAMVGGLALVLKWAFSDVAEPDDLDDVDARPGPGDGLFGTGAAPDAPPPDAPAASAPVLEGVVADTPAGGGAPPVHDDYGLLSVVTAAETEEAARAAVTLLAEAGIRATTTTGADGQVRVLVFDADLFRARRVVGWPA